MAEDQGKEDEKFDFTREGEALGYISLAKAIFENHPSVRSNEIQPIDGFQHSLALGVSEHPELLFSQQFPPRGSAGE